MSGGPLQNGTNKMIWKHRFKVLDRLQFSVHWYGCNWWFDTRMHGHFTWTCGSMHSHFRPLTSSSSKMLLLEASTPILSSSVFIVRWWTTRFYDIHNWRGAGTIFVDAGLLDALLLSTPHFGWNKLFSFLLDIGKSICWFGVDVFHLTTHLLTSPADIPITMPLTGLLRYPLPSNFLFSGNS